MNYNLFADLGPEETGPGWPLERTVAAARYLDFWIRSLDGSASPPKPDPYSPAPGEDDEGEGGEGEGGEGESGEGKPGKGLTDSQKEAVEQALEAIAKAPAPKPEPRRDDRIEESGPVDAKLSKTRNPYGDGAGGPWVGKYEGAGYAPMRFQGGSVVPRPLPWNSKKARESKRWGPMETRTPVLAKKKLAKGAGCTDSGAVLRAPHRLVTDQKVFRSNRAARQGSLLLDASGSMSFTVDQIRAIVAAVPAARIAMYCGTDRAGRLVILARDGRVVADEAAYAPYAGGNTVDAPALLWLAAQPMPRLWFSDGGVCGVSGASHSECVQDCADICAAHKITRVETLEEALKRF